MAAGNQHLYLIFCPYLPLRHCVDFDDRSIGPITDFDGAWADPAFEQTARTFLTAFRDASGKRIERPSVLTRRRCGIDGRLPDEATVDALQLALDIAVLDSNPPFDAAGGQAWRVATSDNSELFIWPLAPAADWVTLERRGALVRNVDAG